MNKRGQIYVLVALILALVLYMLMTKTNIIYEHEIIDDFETLSRNYDIEASVFMNKLLTSVEKYTGEDAVEKIGDDFDEFTSEFTKYARNQNPDFSLIYVFDYNENLYIGNYLTNPIIIGEDAPILLEGCLDKIKGTLKSGGFSWFNEEFDAENCRVIISSTEELSVTIGNSLYIIEVAKDRPEIVIVSREEKGEQRKVYADELVKGSDDPNRKAVSGQKFCENPKRGKTSGVCAGNTIDCEYYTDKKWEEGCKTNENCCWDGKTCKQGRCG